MKQKRRPAWMYEPRPVLADPVVERTKAIIERSRQWQGLTAEQRIDVCAGLHFDALCEALEGPAAKATTEAAWAEQRADLAAIEREARIES